MKTRLLLILLIFFTASVTLAKAPGSSYHRGTLIAVDKRDHRQCADMEAKIRLLTDSRTHDGICTKNNNKPFAIAVVSVPISDYEFLADKYSSNEASKNASALIILPNENELSHHTRLRSHKHLMKIEILHFDSFLDMAELGLSTLSFAFLFKAPASEVKNGPGATVINALAKQRFNYVASGRAFSYPESSLQRKSSQVAITESPEENRIKVGVFFPPEVCEEKQGCKNNENYGIGISFTFIF